MPTNPYVNFVMPSVRVVAKLYREMTPEQDAQLRAQNHLLYHNLLHMVRAIDIIDRSADDARAQLKGLKKRVKDLNR